jgi:hypothetical protein
MRLLRTSLLLGAGLLMLGACGPRETAGQRHHEANTAAGKIGQAAYKAATVADKAGRAMGRKLDKAAHNAKEGWKEAERKDAKR